MQAGWTTIMEQAGTNVGTFLGDIAPVLIVLIALPLVLWVVGALISMMQKRGAK